MDSWKDNKVLKFAVGVTATFLLVRWLITGDLLLAADVALSGPPEDGQTESIPLLSVLWTMFFDAMVIVGAAVMAGVFKLWDWLYSLAVKDKPVETQVAAAKVADVPSKLDRAKQLRQELFDSVRLSDHAQEAKLRNEIRSEFAPPPPPPQPLTTADLDKLVDMIAQRVSKAGDK